MASGVVGGSASKRNGPQAVNLPLRPLTEEPVVIPPSPDRSACGPAPGLPGVRGLRELRGLQWQHGLLGLHVLPGLHGVRE